MARERSRLSMFRRRITRSDAFVGFLTFVASAVIRAYARTLRIEKDIHPETRALRLQEGALRVLARPPVPACPFLPPPERGGHDRPLVGGQGAGGHNDQAGLPRRQGLEQAPGGPGPGRDEAGPGVGVLRGVRGRRPERPREQVEVGDTLPGSEARVPHSAGRHDLAPVVADQAHVVSLHDAGAVLAGSGADGQADSRGRRRDARGGGTGPDTDGADEERRTSGSGSRRTRKRGREWPTRSSGRTTSGRSS